MRSGSNSAVVLTNLAGFFRAVAAEQDRVLPALRASAQPGSARNTVPESNCFSNGSALAFALSLFNAFAGQARRVFETGRVTSIPMMDSEKSMEEIPGRMWVWFCGYDAARVSPTSGSRRVSHPEYTYEDWLSIVTALNPN